jgi:zinc transporter 2
MEKETKLKLAIGLATGFMLVEIVGGYIANSLAIFSDAAHLLTDIAGFAISLVAVVASKRAGCKDYTYGLARAEVFGAMGSILSLWVITAVLVYEAYNRAILWFEGSATPVNGKVMFFVAVFGVFVNLCLGLVFSSEHGGAFHPAHSHCDHDHDHSSTNHHDSHKDTEAGHIDHTDHGHDHAQTKNHGDSCKSGHDHGHGHSTEHDHASHSSHATGHDHSSHATEKSSLTSGRKAGYSEIPSHDEDQAHAHSHSKAPVNDHNHNHKKHKDHDEECGGHDHNSHGEKVEPTSSGYTLFSPPKDFDANIQAAYLHVLTDLIQSIGVALAGLFIWLKPEWQIVDPLCTFVFSILVLSYTIPLVKRIMNVLLEGKPPHIDWHMLEERLNKIEGVQDVHDLHIWSISSNNTAMTVHIRAYNPQQVLMKAHAIAKDMKLQHATIQVQDAAAGNTQEVRGLDS